VSEAVNQAVAKTGFKKFGREKPLPGAYTLDFTAVRDVPVKENGLPSTFGAVYVKLSAAKIEADRGIFGRNKYITDKGEVVIECDWPIAATMRKLVDMTSKGIDPFRVTWMYFDHDWSRDADESYSFFAMCGNEIIDESSHFNAEEPLVLKKYKDEDPIWHTRPLLDAAWEQYWYRKFYTDTLTGQPMVLRPDEPILYYFERPERRDTLRELELGTLVKLYGMIWVAVPLLAAIAFPNLRLYFGILAAFCFLGVLLKAWAANKSS